MEPEIIIKNQPIDIELAELLGEKQTDFLNLCFDGTPLDFFGTPYDLPDQRARFQSIVDSLNDRSKKSLWPKMFNEWRLEICKQFHLEITTYSLDYRPVVSFKIARVCHGYSEHLHAAIGLFAMNAAHIRHWEVKGFADGSFRVALETKEGKGIQRRGPQLSVLIAEAIRDMLKGLKP